MYLGKCIENAGLFVKMLLKTEKLPETAKSLGQADLGTSFPLIFYKFSSMTHLHEQISLLTEIL